MLGKKFFELGLQTGKLQKPYFLKLSYTLRQPVSCALDYNAYSYEHQSITPAAMVVPAANRFSLQNGRIIGGIEAAPDIKTCSRDDANIGFRKESAGKENIGIVDDKTGIMHGNGTSVVNFWDYRVQNIGIMDDKTGIMHENDNCVVDFWDCRVQNIGIMDDKTGIMHENGNSVVDFWVLAGGPRGPPMSPPNLKPLTPPGMPDPVPIPEMPPIPPSGTPPPIPPPEMPPIPPDYPGPIPPPVDPPNTPWPGPEMPDLPSPGPDVFPSPQLPTPPSI